MANETITVRLSPKDIEVMDRSIEEGYFTSRSDLVRYSVRHTMMEMNAKERDFELIREFAKEKRIDKNTVTKTLRSARKRIHREVYGDD